MMLKTLQRLWADDRGVAATDTALIVFLVALIAIGAWQHLGRHSQESVQDAGRVIQSVADGGTADGV